MTTLLAANADTTAHAAALLRAGGLVAFGTETVYGLGADATNESAVAGIFAAKGRPRRNPLIVHYPNAQAANEDVVMTDAAWRLAERFWPGPLTLVLPKRSTSRVVPIASGGHASLAVRVPRLSEPNLLTSCAFPVVAPSANRSGRVSPTRATDVIEELDGRIDLILDSGPCAVGLESSVLALLTDVPVLLRPGGLELSLIETVVGAIRTSHVAEALPLSPGLDISHYAPASPVRLNRMPGGNAAYLGFGPIQKAGHDGFNLSPRANLDEAASRLFTGLRELDRVVADRGLAGIDVAPIPLSGIGLAINDRLARAAAERPTNVIGGHA
jgi:L-threonylcarbamoyladenylate synthase